MTYARPLWPLVMSRSQGAIFYFRESLIKCSLREMEQIRSLLEMAVVKMAADVAELR
jgi:hypothetical protein